MNTRTIRVQFNAEEVFLHTVLVDIEIDADQADELLEDEDVLTAWLDSNVSTWADKLVRARGEYAESSVTEIIGAHEL
ncbi:hypothetical protein ACIQK6_23730 [Streptomyces sp. NPDC091682]|uniref:hypothetical protein n=1 Tax=unclassified Streptomyces TaxID=2593676 RepID=UPI00371A5D0D